MKKRKPTRRDLLIVIGRLQDLFGQVVIAAGDRNPERARDIELATRVGMALCIEARSYDPPLEDTGPWATNAATRAGR